MAEYKKVCKVCGKEFIAFNHRTAYCSELCRIVRHNVVCPMCGREFVRRRNEKYCSEKCAWTAKQIQSQRKSKFRLSANGTLCWHCEWATGKDGHCPWASHLVPVEGWEAKKVQLKISTSDYTDSYIVKECPLSEEG